MRKPLAINSAPRIYCASSLAHASMWREWRDALLPSINVISTWHQSTTLIADETNEALARAGWRDNVAQLDSADCLLVYANDDDKIQGTLVEIGIGVEIGLDIHLVGTYRWGSWRYLPRITQHFTLHDALLAITHTRSHKWGRMQRSKFDE